MKLSEKQAMMLLDIAQDTLRIAGHVGGYPPHIRVQLISDIINQQSNDLKELDQLKNRNSTKSVDK